MRWVEGNLLVSKNMYLPQRHTGHTAVHRIVNAGNFIIIITGEPLLFQCQRRADGRTYNSLSTLCLSRHRRKREYVPLFVLILSSGLKSVVFLSVDNIYIYTYFYVCIHIFIYMYANNSIRHRFHFVTLPTFPWLQAIQYWECVHGTGSPGLVIQIPLPISFMKWGEVRFWERPNETYMNWKGDESRFLLLMMRGW